MAGYCSFVSAQIVYWLRTHAPVAFLSVFKSSEDDRKHLFIHVMKYRLPEGKWGGSTFAGNCEHIHTACSAKRVQTCIKQNKESDLRRRRECFLRLILQPDASIQQTTVTTLNDAWRSTTTWELFLSEKHNTSTLHILFIDKRSRVFVHLVLDLSNVTAAIDGCCWLHTEGLVNKYSKQALAQIFSICINKVVHWLSKYIPPTTSVIYASLMNCFHLAFRATLTTSN